MGKTAEERYVITNPDANATSSQTYALYRICGVDVRGANLTKGGASEYIESAKNGRSRHTRVKLAGLEGAEIKTTDVHKNFRDDPKPKGYKVGGNGNGNGNGKNGGEKLSPEKQLLKLLKAHPDLAKVLLANVDNSVDKSVDNSVDKSVDKSTKTRTQTKKNTPKNRKRAAVQKAASKADPESEDVDIAELLKKMESGIENAVSE